MRRRVRCAMPTQGMCVDRLTAFAMRHGSGQRRLIAEMQRFMTGKEIDPVGVARAHAQDVLHELKGRSDAGDDAAVIVCLRRIRGPIQIPILWMVEVGEAALHQGPHEVQRQGGSFIAAQKELADPGSALRL